MIPKTHVLLAALMAAACVPAILPSTVAESASGGFGVTPVELRYLDPVALRGSTFEGVFHLENTQGSEITVTATPDGAAASWIRIEPTEIAIPDGATRDVRVVLTVPDDAPNGDYLAFLRLQASAPAFEGSGSALAVELMPAVRVRVGGEQVVRLAFDALAVDGAAANRPVPLLARLANEGNVRIAPVLDVEVLDESGARLFAESVKSHELAPRAGGPISFLTSSKLPAEGEYVVKATLRAGDATFGAKQSTFNALAEGATDDALKRGALRALALDDAAEVGAPMKLTVTFANEGPVPIQEARLRGEVHVAGKRVALLDSDALRVAAGAAQEIEAFYTPKVPGVHRFIVHVAYDGLRTESESEELAVAGPGGAGASAADARERPPTQGLPAPAAALALGVLAVVALARRRG